MLTVKFKLILALVVIAGIMGLIAYANTGEKFLQAFKLGRFTNVEISLPESSLTKFNLK